jgi:cyclopropane fatty-acyl-phospholipid synthase-like methyltransferase
LKYAELLAPLLNPKSVVDVGCGRGSWLKAFKEKGAIKLVGYDGSWNNQKNMIDQSIIFHGVDLNKPIFVSDSERFDLAMSLEVAEHL